MSAIEVPLFWTLAELCDRYHCDASTIYRKMKTEGFPPSAGKFGRHRLWPITDVLNWEKEHLAQQADRQYERQQADEWSELRKEHLARKVAPKRNQKA